MRYNIGNGQRLKVALYVVTLTISFFSLSRREWAYRNTSFFENFLIDTFGPMQRGINTIHDTFTSFFSHYVANVNASKKNVVLIKKLGALENKIFNLDQIHKENQRLKDLLRFGSDLPYKEVLAQIVAWDASSDYKVIRINKGKRDGIKLQSTVITSQGLVGYIYRVTNHFSDILTILDPNNRVDGIVERIRAHGILEGNSKGQCKMKYVTRTEPVILDDLVITSGFGNIYPKGIRIGQVSRIERESYGITQYIEIDPIVDFSRLEEVVVLVSEDNLARKKEWDALDKFEDEERGK